jgi:tetratricopeptide (TPR) repeat protein
VTNEERAQLESAADRARRRGEMAEAVRLYRAILDAFPEDGALRDKLAQLAETLQPMELTSAKAPRSETPAKGNAMVPLTEEQEGERLFHLGDFAGAARAYRRALAHKPDSPLIQERLVELIALAQAAPRNSPTDRALPDRPEPLLHALLDRIAARKRVPR